MAVFMFYVSENGFMVHKNDKNIFQIKWPIWASLIQIRKVFKGVLDQNRK